MKKSKYGIILAVILALSCFVVACQTAPVKLATPDNLEISGTTLSWGTVESATGYKLSVDGEIKFAEANQFSLAQYTAVGSYKIKVAATADGFETSDWSAEKTYTISPLPGATQLAAPSLTVNNDASISWTAVANVGQYLVNIDGVETYFAAGKTSYSLAGLTAEGVYSIKVKAVSGNASYTDSDWSAAKTYEVVIFDKVPLNKPANLKVANKMVSWDEVAQASQYAVEIDGEEFIANSTSFSLTRFNEIKTYSIKVKAIGTGFYTDSLWSDPVEYTVYGQLQAVEFDTSSGKIAWNPVMGASKYIVSYGKESYETTANQLENAVTTDLYVSVVAVGENYKDSVASYLDVAPVAFAFTVQNNEVTITGLTETFAEATEIAVPEYIKGYKVTKMAQGCFASAKASVTSVKLPFVGSAINATTNTHFGYIFNVTNANLTKNLIKVELIGTPYMYSQAFLGAKYIESAIISGKIETLPSYAFRQCSALKEVVLPTSLKVIDANAFESCSALQNIVLPEGLEKITDSAFRMCSALVSVSIPKSVNYIGREAFLSCNLVGEVIGGVRYISKWAYKVTIFDLTSVAIQDGTIGIANECFLGLATMKTVTIPDSVKIIGFSAFDNCTGLEFTDVVNKISYVGNWAFNASVDIAGAVSVRQGTLGIIDGAFKNCVDITSISIPDSVKTIALYAFSGCKLLTEVSLKNGLTIIGKGAFNGCTSLENITIPSSVKELPIEIFSGCSVLVKVTLEEGLKKIDSNAFINCLSLGTITIPSSVTNMGQNVFGGCVGLSKIYFLGSNPPTLTDSTSVYSGSYIYVQENDVETYKSKAIWTTISARIFSVTDSSIVHIITNNVYQRYLGNDSTVTIPAGVTKIADRAFNGFYHVKKVILGADVTHIDTYAFNTCKGLEEVDFTAATGLTSIGSYAFFGSGIKKVTLPANITYGTDVFTNCRNLSEVKLSSTMKTIPTRMFMHCVALETLVIPEGVERIGLNCFYNSGLTNVTIPTTIKVLDFNAFLACDNLIYETVDGVNYLAHIAMSLVDEDVSKLSGDFKFRSGTTILYDHIFEQRRLNPLTTDVTRASITSFDFTGYTSIGHMAFYGSHISSVTIPESVLYLGNQAFDDCEKLTTVNYNSSADINAFAFADCDLLSTVTFGSTGAPKMIGSHAFEKSSIAEITIPASVTSMGAYVFYKCAKLVNVIYNASAEVADYTFLEATSLSSITFNSAITSIGMAAFENTAFTSFTFIDSVKTIGENAFKNCKKLLSVDFNKVTSIGVSAFENSALTTLDFTDSVKSIDAKAFKGCVDLVSVNFNKVQTIGVSAFEGSGLTSVSLTDSVTSLGDYAFKDCVDLSSVNLNKLTTLGLGSFNGCTELKSITLPVTITKITSGDGMFEDSGVETVYINTIATLGNGDMSIFYKAANLNKIVINVANFKFNANQFKLSADTYANLKEIEFGQNVTISGTPPISAFANLKLEKLTIKTSNMLQISHLFNSGEITGRGIADKIYVPSNLVATYKEDNSTTVVNNKDTITGWIQQANKIEAIPVV